MISPTIGFGKTEKKNDQPNPIFLLLPKKWAIKNATPK